MITIKETSTSTGYVYKSTYKLFAIHSFLSLHFDPKEVEEKRKRKKRNAIEVYYIVDGQIVCQINGTCVPRTNMRKWINEITFCTKELEKGYKDFIKSGKYLS
jgi:hypothetical protein